MALIKFTNKSAYDSGEISGNVIDALKGKFSSADEYSVESSTNFISGMVAGELDMSSFESTALEVGRTLGLSEEAIESKMVAQDSSLIAATVLANVVGNPKAYVDLLSNESSTQDGKYPVSNFYGNEFDDYYSAESFDNQVLTEFMPVSVGLAYSTGKQEPALEAIYRTITLTPEQGGLEVETPLLFVANTNRHELDGSKTSFNYRRVIDATINHEILVDNSTRLIPSFNDSTEELFVSEAEVPSWTEVDGTREVKTAALATRTDINLFGLGQQDAVSKVGQLDYTEALDRNIGLDRVWINLAAGKTILFKIKGVPFSRFIKGAEGNTRIMNLRLPLSTLIIDGNTKTELGQPLTGGIFDTIRDGGYTVRLRVVVNGEVDVEHGVININPGNVTVTSVTDEDGNLISLTEGTGKAIKEGLASAAMNGWYPDAMLTNSNHRFLGQRLNSRGIKERLITRTRSPIFIPMPLGENRDKTALEQLTWAVQTNKHADGITNLIGYHERLMELTGGLRGDLTPGDFEENVLPIEGIGRNLINPYVQTVHIDLDEVQALDTNAKINNAQTHLVNAMRSVYFDIMQRTNYRNAARYLDGGEIKKKFKATFLTSDTLHRFVTTEGDSRTLGADVAHEIFSTVDRRLKGEGDQDYMYMVFTREGNDPDPLTSGILLNTPSIVSTLQTTRDNTVKKELVIQPRYAHYHLCPIIVKFVVNGAHKLLEENLAFRVQGLTTLVEGGGQDTGGAGTEGETGGEQVEP